jgi:hypothetical protein
VRPRAGVSRTSLALQRKRSCGQDCGHKACSVARSSTQPVRLSAGGQRPRARQRKRRAPQRQVDRLALWRARPAGPVPHELRAAGCRDLAEKQGGARQRGGIPRQALAQRARGRRRQRGREQRHLEMVAPPPRAQPHRRLPHTRLQPDPAGRRHRLGEPVRRAALPRCAPQRKPMPVGGGDRGGALPRSNYFLRTTCTLAGGVFDRVERPVGGCGDTTACTGGAHGVSSDGGCVLATGCTRVHSAARRARQAYPSVSRPPSRSTPSASTSTRPRRCD